MPKQALLLLGGTWHDFKGFAQWVKPLLAEQGYAVVSTYDPDALLRLREDGTALVVQYTSFGAHLQFPEATPGLTAAQTEALRAWVSDGGRLLGVHSATVVGVAPNEAQQMLLGARFVEHPPQFCFGVYPLEREHPMLTDVEALMVHDEFYMQVYGDDCDVLMVSLDRGRAYPMVWTRQEGAGRVAYVGMEHSAAVWQLEGYGQLMRNTVAWMQGPEARA